MDLKIMEPRTAYQPVQLREPPGRGYVHIAAAVRPPRAGRSARPPRSPARADLLARLKSRARRLEALDTVVKATVYEAVVIPPRLIGYARLAAGHPARYDVVVLIETASPQVIDEVRASEPYELLFEAVADQASDLHVMAARCERCIADVDKTRQGLFLFNYFVADDAEVARELWEYLASWFEAKTKVDNSTLLEPIGEADYVFVNHARWDVAVPRLAARMFLRPSFHGYVLRNLMINRTGSMPLLYRLA